MNQSLDKSLYYLTGNGNLDTVTVEELEKLVNDYPYFAVSHFLLSKKLNTQNNKAFLPQVQKTALYFPNPYWLHYQLLNDLPDEPIILENKTENQEANAEDSISEDEVDGFSTANDEAVVNEEAPLVDDSVEEKTHETPADYMAAEENETRLASDDKENDSNVEIPDTTQQRDILQTDNATNNGEKILEDDAANSNTTTESPAELALEYQEQRQTSLTPTSLENNEAETQEDSKHDEAEKTSVPNEELVTTYNEPVLSKVDETSTPFETTEEHVSQPEEEMAAITRDTDISAEHFLNDLEEQTQTVASESDDETIPIEKISLLPKTEKGTLTEIEETDENLLTEHEEIDEHETMFRNIKAMLDASTEDANADTKNAVVPIDPYYTIDYFASQGIKLDLNKNADDKLGKQVKKFTQWLKHMKKLGPEDALPSETVSAGEMEAQRIADKSNTAREVVTEAMAQVLEKQGKKDKAVELYKKLSFLNPDKSAYFAAKIKNLNSF